MDATQALATHVATTTPADLPADVDAQAKRLLRDVVGIALYGSQHPTGDTVDAHLETLGRGGGATVVGRDAADPVRAAFANGAFAHVGNYDDTFESVVVHPSCTAFPAALAAAESVATADGRDLLCGYVVGLDVLFRVGRALAPTHWHRGWHATATVGVFGATAAAASVFGLSADETRHALGLAGSFASGLKKNIGTMGNPLHCGHAAGKGVEAALLARTGATSDASILDGEYGYGAVATEDAYDPTEITDPAVEWAVRDVARKPYPSGVVTHSAMESLRGIVEREDLAPDDVARVVATVDERVMDTIDEHDPQDAAAANVSYEFCLAAVLRERDVGVEHFTDDYVRDPATREAMATIHVDPRSDPPFDAAGAEASYGSRVAVETVDGRRFEAGMATAPGGPSNPVDEARWEAKFFECAEAALDRAGAERVAAAVDGVDDPGGLDAFVESVRPRGEQNR